MRTYALVIATVALFALPTSAFSQGVIDFDLLEIEAHDLTIEVVNSFHVPRGQSQVMISHDVFSDVMP
jgi:hypothetical protein